VGSHELTFGADHPALQKLTAGDYELVVEASREVGGRELVRIPFTWGNGPVETAVQGESELGAVTLKISQP
jgi:hypothetical protein